ncbi:GNAT family N-acetyltransferase [Cytophagales bacterium LB-30]|uniref:GNAT family N-acetyltransferase n=1 Tax=Shiella aurantiaca TaxID=3058365 RepID=A0ABT8F409_9BACT|nr:GNAT family N-acetyltransferase [Shiella aurantiaca]MDN4164736.1 GNAT family N-acetyltransferase [Shiella aurantiaca]
MTSTLHPTLHFEALTAIDNATFLQKNEIADFLFVHLEQYGDKKEDIMKCLDYALDNTRHQGGFVMMARQNAELVGAVVINHTGMSGYIPENILVYIAVHGKTRGMGIGKQLMEKAIEMANGNIALHVEPDNPARKLYEKLGFTNKYLEMRLNKS